MSKQNPLIMKYYDGNKHLKAAGVKIRYTKEQIQERIKCTQDPIYFIEKYMKVVHVDHGLVPLRLYDFQKELLQSYIDNRFVIARLARQSGKSTVTIAYILWVVLFGPMQNIAVLANKGATAKEILNKLELAYEYIPLWMQQGIIAFNKGSIELENGSRVIATTTTTKSVRGFAFNIIFLDEFAFVPENVAEEFITSVMPTISSGNTTKMFMVSTPNGMNLFRKFWMEAVSGKNLFKPIQSHWSSVPGRDDQWREDQIRQMGHEKFEVEYGCEFVGSTNTLVASSKLSTMTVNYPLKRIGNMDVYFDPIPEHVYVISVDVSRGQNLDYSAFTIIDATQAPYKLVAKYRNNQIQPMMFPSVIYNAAKQYNEAWVLIEINDIGGQVADILYLEFEYENIFSTIHMGRGGQFLSSGFKKNSRLGIRTTKPIKSIGCGNLKTMIEGNQLLLEDLDIRDELFSFVSDGKSFNAEPGRHDDLVMTLVFFSWLTSQSLFKEITDVDIRKRVLAERLERESQDLLPFGQFSDGIDEGQTIIDSSGELWMYTGLEDLE